MAFQRVNWQKLGPWALNLENLRHDNHQQGAEQRAQHPGGDGMDGVEDVESKHGRSLSRSHSTGNQKTEPPWKRLSNADEFRRRRRGCTESDADDDMAD